MNHYFPTYPEKFDLWKRHDLCEDRRPWFYKNVKESDHDAIWRWMESNYLEKYLRCYRIWFEWASDGIWGIPFPGSVSVRGNYDPEDLALSQPVANRLYKWHSNIEKNYDHGEEDNFDLPSSDAEGLEVAKLIRLELDPRIYLEYHDFRELVFQDSAIVELPVPKFISNYGSPRERADT